MGESSFLSWLPLHIAVTWSGSPCRCIIYHHDERHDLGKFWSAESAAKAAEKYIVGKGWFDLSWSPAERRRRMRLRRR